MFTFTCPWVILHSAEEDNLSPFDSKIASLCRSIEINNKHKGVHVFIRFGITSLCQCNQNQTRAKLNATVIPDKYTIQNKEKKQNKEYAEAP